MYITKFGGYDLPAQYEMFESQGASKIIETLKLSGLGGSFRLAGESTSPIGEDSITKRFIVVSDTEANLQTAIDDLVNQIMLSQNDFRQGEMLLVALLPDGARRCTWAECQEVRWSQEYYHFDNAWLGPVDITWLRSASHWYTYDDMLHLGDHHTFANVDADGATYGQGVFEQTINTSPATFTITNDSQQRIVTGIVEFDGRVLNPTVINQRNDYQFTWTGSLLNPVGSGGRFTLNIANFDAKKNGVRGEWANMTLGTARGQLLPMALEPGENDFIVTSTSINCKFRFYYAKTWL